MEGFVLIGFASGDPSRIHALSRWLYREGDGLVDGLVERAAVADAGGAAVAHHVEAERLE